MSCIHTQIHTQLKSTHACMHKYMHNQSKSVSFMRARIFIMIWGLNYQGICWLCIASSPARLLQPLIVIFLSSLRVVVYAEQKRIVPACSHVDLICRLWVTRARHSPEIQGQEKANTGANDRARPFLWYKAVYHRVSRPLSARQQSSVAYQRVLENYDLRACIFGNVLTPKFEPSDVLAALTEPTAVSKWSEYCNIFSIWRWK